MFIFNCSILLIVTLFLYLYWFFKKSYEYFEIRKIPYEKPYLCFGNFKNVFLIKENLVLRLSDLHRKLEPHRYAGIFTAFKPTIMIRDPDLIKQILVKDFSYFCNRGTEIDKNTEPIRYHLFNMKGNEWKNLRIKITSAFSSGKMKMMLPLMKKCAEDIAPTIKGQHEVEVKDLFTRYFIDVIGNCVFGLEIQSLQNPSSEFRKVSERALSLNFQRIIRLLLPELPNTIIKWFKLHFFDESITGYFTKIVMETVKFREEHNIRRYDFMDLLIALRNNTKIEKFEESGDTEDLEKFLSEIGDKFVKSDIEMTNDLMTAMSFLFLAAGYEGNATTLSFMLVELAHNQEIQQKVREEVTILLETNEGDLTYDMLNKMTYTNMVLLETLRKHPSAGQLARECTENYKFPDSNIIINKGTRIMVSIHGLHMDPRYYEKPDEFYPEHFTEEAKTKRPHFSYIPFGEGPRMCIAERFSKVLIKVALVYLIRNFILEAHPKTTLPLKYLPGMGLTNVKGGIWIKFRQLL